MRYKHMQPGYLILFFLVLLGVYLFFILKQVGFHPFITIVVFGVLFILASFTSLHVNIDAKAINLQFGYGVYRKFFRRYNCTY